jgi:hypothetical protein
MINDVENEVGEPEMETRDARFWQIQIALSDKEHKDFIDSGREVVERFKNEKRKFKSKKTFNILWSNTETMKAAIFARMAKPAIKRMHNDQDPIGRQVSECIERALIYCCDKYDAQAENDAAVNDTLLPGRGVVRIKYEPEMVMQTVLDPMGMPQEVEGIGEQKLCFHYVYWEDFRHSPARRWQDVTWVAYRLLMTKEELEAEFGEEIAAEVPLNWSPDAMDKKASDDLKRAEVWEIWDKDKKQRLYISTSYEYALKITPDPYGLYNFFDLAQPLQWYVTNETFIPQPEFHVYKDQADDLDDISGRISALTKSLKRRGVYDSTVKELARLARGNDNEFIAVENYQNFTSKGGLQNTFQTEDISVLAQVITGLTAQRAQLVQEIYEITGVSDILRGSSNPNETATAQRIKGQFGSMRLKSKQSALQAWIRDNFRIMAEIIAEHFEPQNLQEITGIEITPEMMQLMRSDKMRSYRIDIETDSTVFEDAENEKQARVELLTSASAFIEKSLPVVQQVPELAPFMFEMLGFGIRGFKSGSQLEQPLEEAIQALMQKMQMAQQQAQMPPLETTIKQKELEIKQAEGQLKAQIEQAKLEIEQQRLDLERDRMAIDASAVNNNSIDEIMAGIMEVVNANE